MRKVSLAFICFMLLSGVSWAQYYPKARQIATNTSNFDTNLGVADTDVQKALDTLDDVAGGSQTPWTSDIDGAGYDLTNVSNLVVTGNSTVPTFAFSNSTDQLLIQQSNATGTEWVSGNPTALIWINDDRTGTTVNEKQEAALVIDTAITTNYALYTTGNVNFGGSQVHLCAALNDAVFFSQGSYGAFQWYTDDGLHLVVGSDDGWGNRNIVICDYASRAKDFDHTPISTNPTLFIHSTTNPDSDNTQWISFTHNTTYGVIDTGTNNLAILDNVTAPFFIGDGSLLTGIAGSGNVTAEGITVTQIAIASDTTKIVGDGRFIINTTTGLLSAENVTVAGTLTATLTGNADTATALAGGLDNLIALTSNTTGNYVASVATTAPLTGGAAGSEGATLTIVIPKATAAADGYLNMTDWSTFNNSIDAEVDPTVDTSAEIMAIIGADGIKDTHIDWGTGASQVSSDDVIVGGTNIYFNKTAESGTLALKNQTKSISIYNITVSHDVLLWQTPKAITITNVSMVCTGGTDVVAVLQECNVTGQACVNLNTTFWQTLADQGSFVDDFDDAAIAANAWVALNVTTVNGTPSNWALNVKYDEN